MKFLEQLNKQEFSIAIGRDLYDRIKFLLGSSDIPAKFILGLYKPSIGKQRFTALIHEILVPKDGQSAEDYLFMSLETAGKENSGIAISHFEGVEYENVFDERILNNIPFIVLTISDNDHCTAYIRDGSATHDIQWAVNIRVVGKTLDVSYNDTILPKPGFREIYKRTITVWGEQNHAKLARLRIGIIGLGSVGSIVAESLARMGIERFVLMDFDEIQEHNLDRLLGASKADIGKLKVDIAERQITVASTASTVNIEKTIYGITEKEGYEYALDCDVLFSCVDRPWPRYVMNALAYNHLIPVVDGGIQVRLDSTGNFLGADWQLQTVGPGKACLQCLNAYYSADVATERQGLLDDPTYIAGLPDDHTTKRNENIFPFSANLASLEILQLIELVTNIAGKGYHGWQRYSYNHGYIRINDEKQCDEGCHFQAGIGLADTEYGQPYGFDHAADDARKRQALFNGQ